MTEHYFSAEPDVPERRSTVSATIWGHRLEFVTATGTFSHTGLDPATAVLFRAAEPPGAGGRFLDLGCGWGPIALALAVASPDARVDAVDVNNRALRLCAENAATAGVSDRIATLRPDQVDPATRYDQIWSNPPIRIGKDALHALLLDWLPRLSTDGVARLVVGRNLGADSLQTWLSGQGFRCERAASAKGFRVLAVRAGPAG